MTPRLIQRLFGATILNPNLYRTPPGRIGTALFLLFAVSAVVLTAMVSSFGKKESEYANFPIRGGLENATKTKIEVKVLNPDGTPVDRASVRVRMLTIHESGYPGVKPSYSVGSSDTSSGTDREGNFNFEVPVGTLAMVYAYATPLSRTLVSQPTLFLVTENGKGSKNCWIITVLCLKGTPKATFENGNLVTAKNILQLQEGTLVSGTAMFDDGTPAKDRTISGIRPTESISELLRTSKPPAWATDVNVNNAFAGNFVLEFQTRVQADGKYELYLPPGDFLVKEYNDREGVRAVPVSIAESKDGEERKEHRIDFLAVPDPLRGKFVKEDGTEPGRLEVSHMSKSNGILSTRLETNGEFLFERHLGSVLVAVTEDRTLGVIYPVPDEALAEFHTVVLQPMATVKLELRDALGQPVVDEKIGVAMRQNPGDIHARITTSIPVCPATTGEDGVAEFQLPPGSGFYEFSWQGGTFECERTFHSGETVVMPVTQR